MANSPAPRVGKTSTSYDGGEQGAAIKTPTEARQGMRGRPVLVVLGVSLILAITALGLVSYYFSVPVSN